MWSVLLLAVLANMGVDITAFVASLGVGGVAVALAVQSILSDLFASLAIGLDKPFEIGDFIVLGDIAGSIEHIGLKTTRIRSLGGEEIVCSNTELLKNTIHNYKRMSERRIAFGFVVTYDATPEQLRIIPDKVRQAVEDAGDMRFDQAHFKQLGESSLDFEVVGSRRHGNSDGCERKSSILEAAKKARHFCRAIKRSPRGFRAGLP